MKNGAKCTVCAGNNATSFMRIEDMPVSCNHLCSSRAIALAEPRAVISLAYCPDCGHVFNSEFDATHLNYRYGYENSLGGSDRFKEYDEALIATLLERYRLRGRLIVEIGCGRGHFLRALCDRGGNSGIGFDPSYSQEQDVAGEMASIAIRPQAYGAQAERPRADFICSRHTLEHLGDPRRFLSDVRRGTPRSGVPVFFEVPNGLYTLRDGGIWDILYEHCSYFTPSSLARLFCQAGYKRVEVAEAFAGQFLTIHAVTGFARNSTNGTGCLPITHELASFVKAFAQTYETKLKKWASTLLKLKRRNRRVVVWGAGAKAATFLNLLKPSTVEYVIDVNPRKYNKYVSGTGQPIVPPEFLRDYPPDDIICMNPNYFEEIALRVRALEVQANLICA